MIARKQNVSDSLDLPRGPIERITAPFLQFLHVEAASGVVLLAATVTALVLANSPWADTYLEFWETHVTLRVGTFVFDHSLHHLINDALMAIFFFVIGLEVKRELVLGELNELRRAALPVAAAIGGMVVPAGIYLAMQWGGEAQQGWGIPMATDIAFVVGCMSILRNRVPRGLRVMLLSLAIVDDIGAILVIAIGYTENLQWTWLATGGIGIATVLLLARMGVRSFAAYTAAGIFIWFAFHESGVHATIAGVILGLLTPARSYLSPTMFARVMQRASETLHGDWEEAPNRAEKVQRFRQATRATVSPLEYLEHLLHSWVSFAIMPLFALANAGVPIALSELSSPIVAAIFCGLVLGKPLGIVLASSISVATGLATLPTGVNWRMIVGGGFLSGIGFTMALFIAGLAVSGPLLDTAKIGVLVASLVSAVLGMGVLIASPAGATSSDEGSIDEGATDDSANNP